MPSRLDRSPVANWWWTVDRWFLAAFLSLMGLGIVLSFAASPAVAERIGLDSFHFATRQIVFMAPALAAMLSVSFLDARQIRRLALGLLAVMLVLMVAVLFIGVEVKGSHRWISFARRVAPALGVSETGLRGHLRMAVCRASAPARHSGQSLRRHPALRCHRAAGGAARSRADHSCHRHLGRDVLHGRHALDLDHGGRRAGSGRRDQRLYGLSACGRPHRPLPDRSGRYLPGRHGPRRGGAGQLVRRRARGGHDQTR